jgi:hypothetical protein
MFWHDDIADQSEAVASADFPEDLYGKIHGTGGGQEWSSLVAAKGDEVKIATAGDSLEILGHRREERPTLCKNRKG